MRRGWHITGYEEKWNVGRELRRAASSKRLVQPVAAGFWAGDWAWGSPLWLTLASGPTAPPTGPRPSHCSRAASSPSPVNSRPQGCCNLHFWREHKTVVSLTQGLWPKGSAAVSTRGKGGQGPGRALSRPSHLRPTLTLWQVQQEPTGPWIPWIFATERKLTQVSGGTPQRAARQVCRWSGRVLQEGRRVVCAGESVTLSFWWGPSWSGESHGRAAWGGWRSGNRKWGGSRRRHRNQKWGRWGRQGSRGGSCRSRNSGFHRRAWSLGVEAFGKAGTLICGEEASNT